MTRVRLELNQLRIHRPKERWRLYFVVAADDPGVAGGILVSVIPPTPVHVVPDQHNLVNFEPTGEGTEGLLLLSCELPAKREMNVHFYAMHSRRGPRAIGEILQQINLNTGKEALDVVTALGTTSPWLRIAREGLPVVGKTLVSIPDRQLGFINMYERFGPEFEQQVEQDRESRGGHITAVYTWSVVT